MQLEAFGWGLVAASSLIVGVLLSFIFKIKRRLLGLIMAFGVGVLISAVAYELIDEAFQAANDSKEIVIGLFIGALVFFIGDSIIDHFGGEGRKRSGGIESKSSGLAIVLGTILDGVPESAVIGMSISGGGTISVAMVIAVFISNIPEAVAATMGLKIGGWSKNRIFLLWMAVVLVSALASLAGFVFFNEASAVSNVFMLSFAAGAILTMLADTMMPEAYQDSGKLVGLVTTLGFGLAFAISTLE